MPVAIATNVKGNVTATNAKCEVRTINEGDPIEEGEIIRTGDGGGIDLKLMMGGVISIEAKQTATLDSEFFSANIPDARDNALSVGGDDFNNIIGAIRKGTSLDSLLEETAAGLGGDDAAGSASSGGGNGFVMLAGVVETISPIPATVVDYSLNRGPVVTGNAFAAAQAIAAIQAAAHAAAVHAAAAAASVVADTDAPVITLNPSPGVNAPITGTVTDTNGTVSSVQVTVTNIVTGAATTTTVPVQADGTFTAPAPSGTGSYTVTVTAIDSAGNVSTAGGSDADTAVVDTTAPVITLYQSAGVNAPITGTVTDEGGAVGTVQVTVTDIATGVATTATVPVQASGAFTAPAPSGTGSYTVTVTAIDTAGNISTVGGTAANTVVVDTTVSAFITVDTVAGNDIVNAVEAGGAVAVTGTVGGDAKAGDTVTLTVGTNTYTGTVAANGTYSINVPGSALAANANVGVSITATDVNGNTVTVTADRGYAVDITAPTVTISTDDSVLTVGEVAHLSFILSEASNNFTAADIAVTGGTLTNFAGSGTSYTADFIPTPNSNAPASVTVASGSFADATGNSNEFESTLNVNVNTVTGEILRGGHGSDTLVGGVGDDILYGGTGKDHLHGGSGNDTLYGEQGKDTLKGGLGDDTLYGDQGKDTLKGGLGDDLLYGGEGKDIFAWSPSDIGTPGDPAVDTIADFNHKHDSIDLHNLLDGVEVGKKDIGNLLSYINVSKEGSDTVLHISSQGNFDNGEYHPGNEDQRIVIENVDLTVQDGSDVDQARTLLNMLKNNNLNVNDG